MASFLRNSQNFFLIHVSVPLSHCPSFFPIPGYALAPATEKSDTAASFQNLWCFQITRNNFLVLMLC